MPRKNTRDRDKLGAFHVYNRGGSGRLIFRDDSDRREFEFLIARSASLLEGRLEIAGYCLMASHYHLILWQKDPGAMRSFMASLITAYVKYFNRRHGAKGSLFAGPFRSRHLSTAKQFKWVVAYVHDNHPTGLAYRFSSHRAYVHEKHRPAWLSIEPTLRQFGGLSGYKRLLNNRATRKSLQSEFFDQ